MYIARLVGDIEMITLYVRPLANNEDPFDMVNICELFLVYKIANPTSPNSYYPNSRPTPPLLFSALT